MLPIIDASFRRLNGTGVIVDNPPALRKALPDEREDTTDVAFGPSQMPMPEDESRVRPEKPEFEVGEFQVTHGLAIGIAFLVPRPDGVPSSGDATRS
jgi:hypothetical protein